MQHFAQLVHMLPQGVLTNAELSTLVDTSDEWITKRTGIKERRIAAKNEFTSDLGMKAAQKALERSDVSVDDIDMVVCATISPDYICMPSTAAIISTKLGIKGATAFDISAACTGICLCSLYCEGIY